MSDEESRGGEKRRRKVKWPLISSTATCGHFDDDVENVLETTLASSIARKISDDDDDVHHWGG